MTFAGPPGDGREPAPDHPPGLPPPPGFEEASDPTLPPWRAVEAIPVFLLSLAGGVVVALIGTLFADGDAFQALAVLGGEIALGFSVLLWVKVRHGAGLRDLLVRPPRGEDAGLGLLGGVVGFFAAGFVMQIILTLIETISGSPPKTPEQISLSARPSATVLVVIGFSVIIAAPIAEEIFFRGFLYRALRRRAAAPAAGALSAALFAAAHFIPTIMPSIFVLGLVLAWLVERRGSLVPAMIAHAVFNTAGFLFLVFT